MLKTQVGDASQDTVQHKRVVYLLGAGATHGCAAFHGSGTGLVMPDLIETLGERMREHYYEHFRDHPGIGRLVNDVVDEWTDFEQLITFLEEAISLDYRRFAAYLRSIFFSVLRDRLDKVREELGVRHSDLYAVLVNMHQVPGTDEQLQGFLTLNYDLYLEHAIRRLGLSVDFGVNVRAEVSEENVQPIRMLKLHGSRTLLIEQTTVCPPGAQ